MSRPLASSPLVHLLAGLTGAGKTAYARELETQQPAVRFSLDEWMLRLYQLRYDDPRYPALAEACKDLIWDIARQVLRAGVDVVLDWNQWSRARRHEWSSKVTESGYVPILHYIRVTPETAIARAEQRAAHRTAGAHVLDADAILHLLSIFEEPAEDENIELHIVGQ
jgi:predicted kinase